MRKSTNGPQPKRHAPEFSRSLTKRRRLLSLAAANEDLGSSRILHVSDDDDLAGHDELSAIQWQDDTGPPPPPSSDRPVSSMRRSHGPDSAAQHTTTTTNGNTGQLSRRAPPATDALLPGRTATGQKVRALANALLTNPPRSARPSATDTQDATARVAALHEDYKTLDAKLQLATARLSEQLLSADPASNGGGGSGCATAAGTPASLRPGSSMPVAVHVDEDDAVASALAHIANLEARRAGLLARLHMAQAAELDVRQQRSGRQLAVQVDNARVFRRVVELGPSGVASLLRVLLGAAGVHPSDGPEDPAGDAADAVEAVERRARIRQALDDDLVREGLLPGESRGLDRGDGPTDLIDLGDASHIHDEDM
ncbi:hypothetical protein RB595_006224 [Gaeumannomyces hyphopodioides]